MSLKLPNWLKKRHVFLLSLLLVTLGLQLPLLFEPFGPNSNGDSGFWLLVGYNHFFAQEEAGWVGDTYGGVNPPVFGWLTHFAFRIFGVHDYAARIFSLFYSMAVVVLLFGAVKNLFNEETVFISALIFALHPLTLWVQVINIYIEAPLAAFILGSLFFLTCKNSKRNYALSIALMTFAFMLKFTALLFLPLNAFLVNKKYNAKHAFLYLFSSAPLAYVSLKPSLAVADRWVFSLLFQASYWNHVWAKISYWFLPSLILLGLLGLFFNRKKTAPFLLTILVIVLFEFFLYTTSGTWEMHLFEFVIPLSVLGGNAIAQGLGWFYSIYKRAFPLFKSYKTLIAVLIMLLSLLTLWPAYRLGYGSWVGCYNRDLYKKSAIIVTQEIQPNALVILPADYHITALLEFYVRTEAKVPINILSLHNTKNIEEHISQSSYAYAILHESDSIHASSAYRYIALNFEVIQTIRDIYSVDVLTIYRRVDR